MFNSLQHFGAYAKSSVKFPNDVIIYNGNTLLAHTNLFPDEAH